MREVPIHPKLAKVKAWLEEQDPFPATQCSRGGLLGEQNRLLRHQFAAAAALATFPGSERSEEGTASPSPSFPERMI